MFISLRVKIAGAFFLVLLPAFSAAWLLTTRQTSRALKLQKQEDELVIARNIAAQVDDVLAKARLTVETVAALPDMRKMNLNAIRGALTLVSDTTDLIDGMIAWDPGGRIRVMDDGKPDPRRLIPDDPAAFLVRPALKAMGAIYSDAYKSRTGDLDVAISVPIRAETGGIAGVLSGGMILKYHTLGGIEDIRIGKSGYAFIVDGEGQVIVNPQREHLLENFSLNPPVKELLAQRREGVIEFINPDGISVLSAYAPIREARWGVIVRQPASESYAHIERISNALLGIFAVSLGLAFMVGLSLAWRMGRPVRDLARGVRRVAEGDLDAVVPVQTWDEMGELARGFNAMTSRLRKYVEEAALAERRLARSEKLAAVGQLAAGIAHEIYNPLNVIGGFAEFLSAKTPADDPRRPALEDIGRETERCRRLVADLLGFARERPPRMKPTDLNALAAEAVELAGARARPGGVEVIFRPDGNLPLIEADQDQITQVLMNLLLNACQALPKGGEVELETRLEGDRAVLSVRDNGAGLAPEQMAKIFTPFFTTKQEGTGLGLALSYAFVERHGGELRAENDPRGGARFTMSLPIKGAVHV